MNKSMLCGRLTRDPDVRYSQGAKPMAVARGTLAVDRKFKQEGQPTADFINIVAFGKTAEILEKHCHKGTKLIVEGRIQTGSYTNKDGNKVYTTDVVVENLEFAESKAASNAQNGSGTTQKSNDDGFVHIPEGVDAELPFV
jgi:single-strand DNA-binding protein